MNEARTGRPAIISGLRDIVDRFDDVLLDQWGVLHDGRQVFAAARDCVIRLRAAGKRVAVLSNSGKRAEENMRRLAALGLPPSAYDALVTSGEAAWQGLRRRAAPPYNELGRRCFLISRGADLSAIDGLDLERVADPRDADFIFLAGVDDERADAERWRGRFQAAARRRVPMLCSNPDLVMFGANGLLPAPGALAAFYRSLGGVVHCVGKPHAPIFEAALHALGDARPGRTLIVGDSLDHDVLGGNRLGLPSVLVASGVHAAELDSAATPDELAGRVRALAPEADRAPCWIVPTLTW